MIRRFWRDFWLAFWEGYERAIQRQRQERDLRDAHEELRKAMTRYGIKREKYMAGKES